MRQVLKSVTAIAFSVAALLGAKPAAAAAGGVVFIHGTADDAGTFSCTGSGSSTACTAGSNAVNYWGTGEINSIRNGRPYAVVGYSGGSCAPWAAGGEYGVSDPNGTTGCSLSSGTGNADVIASQIATFLSTSGLSEIAIVTHSGGSNQARYILQNYTKSTNFTKVKNATKRVVVIAGTTDGTYLANEVFSGSLTAAVLSPILSWTGYNGEGVNLLRTNYMTSYNGASSFFGGINNPVQGVNFYSTGGTSGSTCYGVTLWGVCVGITGQTLGGSGCDSALDDAGLLVLHNLYLDSNDSSTFRNSCSDGFISCMGSQRLGNTFGYSEKQDHNQSRRQCNGLDVEVRNVVAGTASGFVEGQWPASAVDPVQIDACGFSEPGAITSSGHHSGTTLGYAEGCQPSNLGNGQCDWDCIALYGHDAAPTWAGTAGHSVVTAWGATDDCGNSANPANTQSTYGGVTYVDSSNDPLDDYGTYQTGSGSHYTSFNGKTCNSTSSCNVSCGGSTGANVTWFTDPSAGTTNGVGYCPQSWVGDGYCDECVLALYGSDGTDCAPGHVANCGGIVSASQPYSGSTFYACSNKLYNETNPQDTSQWLFYDPIAASTNDGICESSECTASTAFSGTSWCNTSSDCPSGSTCSSGGCTKAASDCTTTYNVPAVTCTENNNCTGDYCVGGTCAVTRGTCSTDANCPGPSPATSVCSSGSCTCTTTADCSNGAACVSGSCATSVTQSLCR